MKEQNFKQTEIGKIPVDWEVKTLGEVTSKIVGGGTPSRSRKDFWGDEIPWVTVKDYATFNENSTQEYITKLGLQNSSSNLIEKNTIITPTRMGLGKISIYNVDVSINQDLKAIYPTKEIKQKYFFHWFKFNSKIIESKGNGSTVMGISLDELKSFQIPLPPLSERKK